MSPSLFIVTIKCRKLAKAQQNEYFLFPHDNIIAVMVKEPVLLTVVQWDLTVNDGRHS